MKNISLFFLVFLLFSCKKTKLDGDLAFLPGEWQWQYTIRLGGNPSLDVIYASPGINGFDCSLVFYKKGKLEVRVTGKKSDEFRIIQTFDSSTSDSTYAFETNNRAKNYFSFTHTKNNGGEFIKTSFFPKSIINGSDGYNVAYSLFKKK